MKTLSARSFAKINLSLKIKGIRDDGFHEIETLMQNISLFDGIEISTLSGGIKIECTDEKVPIDENNFCYKAALLLSGSFNVKPDILIRIKKNIPIEAGLGGGSSDAAAVLVALNGFWGLKLKDEELFSFAAKLGSDTPFFIKGGKCLCYGRGEIVEKLPDDKKAYYVIVKPEISVPTKWAYGEWDKVKDQRSKIKSTDQNAKMMGQKTKYGNDLQDIAAKRFPVILEIINELKAFGCPVAQMTGSGSAVFGIVKDFDEGKRVLAEMRNKFDLVYLVETVDKGILID